MKTRLFLLSVLTICCITSVWGQPNHDKIGDPMFHTKFDAIPILRDPRLRMSEDQLSKIDTIQKKAIIDIEKKQLELQQERLNIKEELFLDSPDLTKIKSIVDKKASIASELEYLTIKRDLDIKAIMSKEQFSIFQEITRPSRGPKEGYGTGPKGHRPGPKGP